MNSRSRYLILVVVLLFQVKDGLAAKTYICEQPDGGRSFQEVPCDSKTLKIEERKTYQQGGEQGLRQSDSGNATPGKTDSQNSKSAIRITPGQLLGEWTDATGDGSELVRGIWAFTSDTLRTTRANGISHNHRYELEGKILVIHHPADPVLRQKAWIQKIEIEEITGERITLGEGRLAASKYLYRLQ